MSRGRGREGIGEGRRESCEAPGAQGGEEGEEAAKGPQAESTLTCALPSLAGKWFTCIGCQGSPGFRALSDLTGLPLGIICGHAVMFTIVMGYAEAKPFPNDSPKQ